MKIIYKSFFFYISALLLVSCSDVLDEKPLSFLSPENAYENKDAFENGLIALHKFARDEVDNSLKNGLNMNWEMVLGTDQAHIGEKYNAGPERFWDYSVITSFYSGSQSYWDWGYKKMISNANTIINRVDNPNIQWTEVERNAVKAEALFFRAYAYNVLVNLFGGVPIVIEEVAAPKLDFVRASRLEVLQQEQSDLEFAIEWLPTGEKVDGRITKGAANHLLSEVYISIGLESNDESFYQKAIEAASRVIDSPKYRLMTERFGQKKDQPGNVLSDLFWDYNINRSAGNEETIWALQFEYNTPGGKESNPTNWMRAWGCRYWDLKDPDGKSGMQICDSIGRPVGWIRPTNYVFYDVWGEDWNDMRNSSYNIRRDWYWNNPESTYFGQKVEITADMDTVWIIAPMLRKLEGDFASTGNNPFKDDPVMRLAETYLLRAEAYMWKGDLVNAAKDINVVRGRAHAKPIEPSLVNIDYILDERTRELVVEEPRRRTLVRVGKMYERTIKYNPLSGQTIKPFNELWPIPQSAIDANLEAELVQNPGY